MKRILSKLKNETGMLFRDKAVWIGILLYAVVWLYDGEEVSVDKRGILFTYIYASTYGYAPLVCPLLLGAPCGLRMYEEFSSNHYLMSYSRSSWNRMFISRFFRAWLWGFIMSVIAIILFLVSYMILYQREWYIGTSSILERSLFLSAWQMSDKAWLLLLVKTVLMSMYGAIYSVMGLVAAVFGKNKYLVMAFPFLMDRVITFAFVGISDYIAPYSCTISGNGVVMKFKWGGIPYSFGVLLVWTMVCAVMFAIGLERKRKNG